MNDINGGIYGTDQNGNTVKGVWSLNDALNPDGLQHVMAYYYKNYLVQHGVNKHTISNGAKAWNIILLTFDF